uniref:Uncharacterized protein n=1 Tax=Rhizophagus irregularis (strain DAOM 181602 / DAOM 197198 / MUCL 43194) TaxID=747089 RepID=U9SYQ5_RHIID
MSQLNVDCLNEIFLEHDKSNIRNYGTLNSCLPNELKEILYDRNIITSSLASKLPTFNYASFCKILSICKFNCELKQFFNEQQSIYFSSKFGPIFMYLCI